MTEEVKQAYKAAMHAVWAEWEAAGRITPNAPKVFEEEVTKRAEAILSPPKPPPKGATCEAWATECGDHWPCYSDGEKLIDLKPGSPSEYGDSWEFADIHYRVIPTAQDAVDVLLAFKNANEVGASWNERESAGFHWACREIGLFIDNAETG